MTDDREQPFGIDTGLSENEKHDLETMIGNYQQSRQAAGDSEDTEQKQIEALQKRLAYLTSMFLDIDRRMKPLFETVRLLVEKSEVLNQRIDTVIDALRSGDPL
jgi:chromosome segregation ATPase